MMGKTFLLATTALIAFASLTPTFADDQNMQVAAAARTQTAAPAPDAAPPRRCPPKAPASAQNPEYDALKARVEQLEKDAADKKAADSDTHTRLSTLEQNFNYATWSFDNGRPTITSGDGRFSMSIRGRFQFDAADFMQDIQKSSRRRSSRISASGAVVRRAFIGVEGKSFSDFWYEFRLDAGGASAEGTNPLVNIARVAYQGIPNFRINIGVIQPIFTMDDATSSANLMFMERSEINNIATSSFSVVPMPAAARKMTFQKTDALLPGDNLVISGAYTGAQTTAPAAASNQGNDEGTNLLGRTAYRFWSDGVNSNAQIGMSGAEIMSLTGSSGHPSSALTTTFQDRPELRIDGTQLISTSLTDTTSATGVVTSACNIAAKGQLNKSFTCNAMTGGWLYGFEGGANFDNFFVGGEYYKFGEDRDFNYYQRNLTAAQYKSLVAGGNPEFSGWYVDASCGSSPARSKASISPTPRTTNMLRGRRRNVVKPFSLSGNSWGAWELAVARYADTNLNWNAGSAGSAVPVGGIRGGEEKIYTIGMNWYLNKNIKWMFDYGFVTVDKLNGSGATQLGQKSSDTLGTRLQYSF